jgi:hypothetical protein
MLTVLPLPTEALLNAMTSPVRFTSSPVSTPVRVRLFALIVALTVPSYGLFCAVKVPPILSSLAVIFAVVVGASASERVYFLHHPLQDLRW